MIPNIMGIAGFGLRDSVFYGQSYHLDSWRMADVLLAKERGDAMRFGQEAAADRACCGFFWPPEARLELDNLRRAPVPALWRALVDSADTRCMWKTRTHGETPVARMLAGHLHHLYSHLSPESSKQETPQPVICIPDKLDERGQDELLKELHLLGTGGTKPPLLLWRPVAAALAWLKSVESAIRSEVAQRALSLGVIYLGPDSIEMTRLEIKLYPYEGKTYVLPRRNRPTPEPEYTGMDWAGNLLQSALSTQDNDTFWQCFGAASGLWKSIAEYTTRECEPQYYNSRSLWHQWNPEWSSPVLNRSEPAECTTLRNTLRGACGLNPCHLDPDTLEDYFKEILTMLNRPQLHSLIVCGPLVGHSVPPWLERMMKQTGFSYSSTPTAGKIWLAPGNAAIAEGSAIYGQKCDEGIPAYLDTLPPLSLLADKEHDQDFEWCPLFKEREVLGGHEAQHTITDRFALKPGSDTLQIWLSRKEHKNMADDNKPSELNFAMERIICAWVRKKGSLKRVKSMSAKLSAAECTYALTYAQKLFGGGSTGSTDDSQTPYRKATIPLETIPETQVPLDVHVTMKPAAGLASVKFVPKQEGVFQKQSIRLDFDKMQPNPDVPQKKFGWPGLQKILVHPEDAGLHTFSKRAELELFYAATPSEFKYTEIISNVVKTISPPRQYAKYYIGKDDIRCEIVAENGDCATTHGENTLSKFAEKVAKDFLTARDEEAQRRLIKCAELLKQACRPQMLSCIAALLKDASPSASRMDNAALRAGACTFSTQAHLQVLFEHIIKRITLDNQIKRDALFAAQYVLKYHPEAHKWIQPDHAWILADAARNNAKAKGGTSKPYKTRYYQSILLLLYLLLLRIGNRGFGRDDARSMELYEEVIGTLKDAVDYHKQQDNKGHSKKNLDALIEFQNFVYYEATADIPSAITELAEEDDES